MDEPIRLRMASLSSAFRRTLRQIGQLLHVLDEHQPRPADLTSSCGSNGRSPFTGSPLSRVPLRFEVTDDPSAVRLVNLGVLAVAQFVLEDDTVGGPRLSVNRPPTVRGNTSP